MAFFPSSTAGAGGIAGNGQDGVVIQAIHSSGLTRIVHAPNARDGHESVERLFTGGDDYLVRILPCQLDSPIEPMVIDDATKAITWIDADADYLVTGSEDGCVRIYQHSQPLSEMESQMTSPTDLVCLLARSSLAIRCVVLEKAVSPGKTPRVAVCSDELVIKVVDAGDPKRVQLLTGHSRGLRAASWHPLRPQLLTTSCDGSIKIWDLSSTEPACIKTLESILPVSSSTSEQIAQAIYHPSGDYFVLPSKTHELVAISTIDYRRVGSYIVAHDSHCSIPTGEISSFAFSPNGRYVASATTDGKVTIWESETRQAIRSLSRQSIKTGISWHPTMNALAWTDTMGQLCRWSDVVGDKYPSPCEYVEYLPASQLKQRKQRDEIDDLFGDTVPDDEEIEIQEAPRIQPRNTVKSSRERIGGHEISWSSSTKAQPTFQPTSTPMRSGRRYMCLNMIGSLMSIEQDSQQSISFESHDANARRNWRFIDHYGYTMASIGTTGALFACPSKEGEANESSEEDEDEEMGDRGGKRKGRLSSIHFKPFESVGAWTTSGSEWSIDLAKGEDAIAVAVGGFKGKAGTGGIDNVTAIVATSKGYLRFFSASGMQRYIWALGSQVVSMAAGRRLLLIVHRGNCSIAAERYQNLSYTLIDLVSFAVRQEGILPLGRDATLSWIGFNDLDFPAIYDSRQTLYVLDRNLGAVGQARWVPVLEAASESVKFWPVGLNNSNLMTVFLKGNSLTYPDPTLSSRPLIQEVKLKMPLLNSDAPTGALEEQYLKNVQMASFIRTYQASLMDDDEESQEVLNNLGSASTLEHESDKALLQLVQLSCKSDKHQRVLDAVKELHSTRTLDAALQIGAFFHLSSLVDRMSGLREWVESRKERDEQLAWSGLSTTYTDVQPRSEPRILAGSSQSPMLEDSRTRKAALSKEFAAGSGKKSYGEGGRSDLAKLGASPASTFAMNSSLGENGRYSDKENNDERDHTRGQKRRAEDGEEEEVESPEISASEGEAKRSALNPFANKAKKISSSKNPFARTVGMTRDRSMHKSSSFFDRVDASLDNVKEKSNKGNKTKQTTLFSSITKSKVSTPTISSTPAFANAEDNVDNDEGIDEDMTPSSLQLTLQAAARKDEASLRLQETQQDDDEESQFDSLPIDVSV